ncbi:MAG: pseudouridine synthase [Pseudomonadales bacterium]|jgi:23S rRNA pseudouridine2457 synthase
MAKLILLNKPFGVLSQFTGTPDETTLASYLAIPGVYPAGRLDKDSEGLLLLTDDGQLQHQIAHPSSNKRKTYQVEIEGNISDEALEQLSKGVELKDGLTRPAKAKRISCPTGLWERDPPVNPRLATSWIELTISEGKNRQVRRMTAAVGNPTLRLIRIQIGPWNLDQLLPGEYRELTVNMPINTAKTSRGKTDRTKTRGRMRTRR